jgi:CheY-like chemotaxis protein
MPKRILVIDNEPYIQEVTKICLQTVAGWEIVTASSGQEGLVKAELDQPDAILLDLMMPDMNGLDTFQALQNHPATQHIPVLLLSAKLQTNDYNSYSKLGVKGAIAKPFDPLQLASQIATTLGWNQEP